MEFQYRRLPASPKNIIDINPEKDVRIRILGKVIDKQDGAIVIDDGTTTAQIITEANPNTGDLVCVFARVLPLEDGYELRGEVVQDRNKMDIDLYKKVYGG